MKSKRILSPLARRPVQFATKSKSVWWEQGRTHSLFRVITAFVSAASARILNYSSIMAMSRNCTAYRLAARNQLLTASSSYCSLSKNLFWISWNDSKIPKTSITTFFWDTAPRTDVRARCTPKTWRQPRCSVLSAAHSCVLNAKKSGMKQSHAMLHSSQDLALKAKLHASHFVQCASWKFRKMKAATIWRAGSANMNGAGYVIQTTSSLIAVAKV